MFKQKYSVAVVQIQLGFYGMNDNKIMIMKLKLNFDSLLIKKVITIMEDGDVQSKDGFTYKF